MDQQHTLTFIDTGPDHTKVPDVPAGRMRAMIVASRSSHDGQISTFCGYYLNGYLLDYQGEKCSQCPGQDKDGCCPKDLLGECPTTGWFYDESNFEYDNCYHRIEGAILAFAEIPQYRTAPEAEPTKSEAARQ